MKKGRVLYVLRPAAGGLRRHLHLLLSGLDRGRFEPLAAGPFDAGWQSLMAELDVPYYPLDLSPSMAPRRDLRAAWQMGRHGAALAPHLVHAHGSKAALVARLGGRRRLAGAGAAGAPVIYTVHGGAAPNNPLWSHMLNLVERRLAPRTAAYLSVSRALARTVEMAWGLSPGRVQPLPLAIDPAPFLSLPAAPAARSALGLDPGRPAVGMVGRLGHEKGPDLFVRMAARVARAMPGCQFVLAGEGPARETVTSLAVALGLENHLFLLGHRDDVPLVLAALDVYVQPSRSEGLGLALLEALAAGRATVASNVGGLPEVLGAGAGPGGETPPAGLLVAPGDVTALARAVTGLLADEVGRRRWGEAARRRVLRLHNPAAMVDAVEATYEAVMAAARPGGTGWPGGAVRPGVPR